MTHYTRLIVLALVVSLQLIAAADTTGDASSTASTPKAPSTWTLLKQAFGAGLIGLIGALYMSPKVREKWVTYNGVVLAYGWYCFRKVKARATGVHVPESKRK